MKKFPSTVCVWAYLWIKQLWPIWVLKGKKKNKNKNKNVKGGAHVDGSDEDVMSMVAMKM